MSKKKLLEESTVRSFMKLANIGTLSDKFIQESWAKEEGLEEAEHKEDEEDEKEDSEKKETVEESDHRETTPSDRAREDRKGTAPYMREAEEVQEEVVAEVEEMEEGETLEEGDADGLKPLKAKMGEGGKPAAARQGKTKKTPAAMSKPNQGPTQSKMKGVEGMKKIASKDPNNGQMKPLKVSTKHVGHGTPMKMNESMEEEADMAPPPDDSGSGAPSPSDEAGESPEHQETVKDALKKMLSAMQDIAKEYGVDMAVDAGGGESPEGGEDMEAAPPPDTDSEAPEGEEESVMEMETSEKMTNETLDRLTKRVAARLLKRK